MLQTIKNHTIFQAIKRSVVEFNEERAFRHGAAVSYYTLISLVPMMVVIIFFCGLIFGKQQVQDILLEHFVGALTGEEGAEIIYGVIENMTDFSDAAWITKVVGILILLFTSTAVFNSIKTSIHALWHIPLSLGKISKSAIDRLRSFLTLIIVGFVIVLVFFLESLIITSLDFMGELLPMFHGFTLIMVEFVLALIMNAFIFGMIYKLLPSAVLSKKKLIIGSVTTAFLFQLGGSLIAWYLHAADLGTTYGVIGSITLILIWVFYSANMIFFGAKFIFVFSKLTNDPIIPKKAWQNSSN